MRTCRFFPISLIFCFLSCLPSVGFAGDEIVRWSCTLRVAADAEVRENAPTSNYGTLRFLNVRPEIESGGSVRRAFLAVDLASDCTETGAPLPVDAVIENAYLRLFTHNGPGTSLSHDLTRVAEAGVWDEGSITWSNQPAVVAPPSDAILVTTRNRWINEWDVAADLELFRAGTVNNGWRISPTDESFQTGSGMQYLASEYEDHADSQYSHPRVQIRYRTTIPAESLSDTALLLPDPTLDRFTVTPQCEAGVDVYQIPYGRNKLLVGKDLADAISLRDISDSLLFLDHADELFSQIFGYEYTQDVPGREPEIRLCSEINNAGTDNNGIGMPSTMYVGLSTEDGRDAYAEFLFTLAHERIHTWQHRRGSLFMQEYDAGHAQLVGLEPVFYELARQGFLNQKPMPPELRGFAIYHAGLERYLADPARTWDTYFSPAAISDYLAGTAPITDDADRQLIYSGIFEWIRRVHGTEGLAAFHAEVEALRIAAGWTDMRDLPDRSADERNDLFLEALIGGLEVDAAEYFEHWKMPVSGTLLAYSQTFPVAPGVQDLDMDGFTPLEGDFDDGDNTSYPRAPELPDGKDNNFDGQIDEAVIQDDVADLSGDPSVLGVALPAVVFGEISDLADVDALHFDLASDALVTVILRAVDSEQTVADTNNGKEVETFVGRATIDGASSIQPSVRQLQHATFSEALAAGTHEILISAASFGSIPANPGTYVLQVFVNDYDSPGLSTSGYADFDYKLANGGVLDPGFSCDAVRDASTEECQALVGVFEHLGGDAWLDARGWLESGDVCYWKGVRCDAAGVDRLLLDSGEGRTPVGELTTFDWSALATSLSVLEFDGDQVVGALPVEFGNFALEVFRFDPSGDLCVPAELRTWFDAIPSRSGDLPECPYSFYDGFESGDFSAWSFTVP